MQGVSQESGRAGKGLLLLSKQAMVVASSRAVTLKVERGHLNVTMELKWVDLIREKEAECRGWISSRVISLVPPLAGD